MKIYVHWDMEGVNGIFTREHFWYWEKGSTSLRTVVNILLL